VTIQPDGYLVVFASVQFTTTSEKNEIHTNLQFGAAGDKLIFANTTSQGLARITISSLPPDISYGLLNSATDASETYCYFVSILPENPTDLTVKPQVRRLFPIQSKFSVN